MTFSQDQSLADILVNEAVYGCACQKFSGDVEQTRQALRQGRCDICEIFRDHLVLQIGQYLGKVDPTIKAIVKYEPELAPLLPQSQRLSPESRRRGINLIAWVGRKSAALSALGSSLETTVAESRRKLGCQNAQPACFNLDIQIVDDREVSESRGAGLMVKQPFLRSIQIWKRPEPLEEPSPPAVSEIDGILTALDLELAPENVLFEQAYAIEKVPPEERHILEARLRELKVILIRRLISDQLAYINIAKDLLTIGDLEEIHRRRIGNGKIGGKAAGLILAARILQEKADEELKAAIRIPPSVFLGSDLIYIFMAMNGLMHWNNQKYKPEEQIYRDYPLICEQFAAGSFPPEVVDQLRARLEEFSGQPLIVRSSSQLEDNFGTSFAGKYQSFFYPNQGTIDENMAALTRAIALTFASTLNPDALLYRRSKGLQDYDERMAVLIQPVQGEVFDRYYYPFAAGVAFSRNLYRWAPQIRREDGFARIVWGLGTHAVERGGNDYPRLVALSHPTLQPDDEPRAIRYYSQKFADVIDLHDNAFKTVQIEDLLDLRYPLLRFLVQIEADGYFTTPRGRVMADDLPGAAVTFDEFLRRTNFPSQLSAMLKLLEQYYRVPVDVEFTARVEETGGLKPRVAITLLQCRPQSQLQLVVPSVVPSDLSEESIIFSCQFMVPVGYLDNVRYVIYVPPKAYFGLTSERQRNEVSRIVSQLNAVLPAKGFICVGPGRWGTTNLDLGVFVNYADVFNAGALVEMAGGETGLAPEPSFGTHFFQDLMEAQIYPVALPLDDPKTTFNRSFFEDTPNRLSDFLAVNEELMEAVKLIAVADYRPGHHLELYLNGDQNRAISFLTADR
jgi:hypothetical protein